MHGWLRLFTEAVRLRQRHRRRFPYATLPDRTSPLERAFASKKCKQLNPGWGSTSPPASALSSFPLPPNPLFMFSWIGSGVIWCLLIPGFSVSFAGSLLACTLATPLTSYPDSLCDLVTQPSRFLQLHGIFNL
ncbi:hypothetical protein VTN02DRAFT_4229 [Thermoascus thermophilus]